MSGNIPFLLKPAAKDYLWGGSRLNDEFNKGIDVYPLAETWECSTHPDGQSLVASGSDIGKTLGDVLQKHPEYLGSHPLQVMKGTTELPVLIKLIDAEQDMSVQVHPDDAYALENENCLGKTEMWYVLAAREGASIVYGFNQDMDRGRVQNVLAGGTINNYLNRVPVQRNDVFLCPRPVFPQSRCGAGQGRCGTGRGSVQAFDLRCEALKKTGTELVAEVELYV